MNEQKRKELVEELYQIVVKCYECDIITKYVFDMFEIGEMKGKSVLTIDHEVDGFRIEIWEGVVDMDSPGQICYHIIYDDYPFLKSVRYYDPYYAIKVAITAITEMSMKLVERLIKAEKYIETKENK